MGGWYFAIERQEGDKVGAVSGGAIKACNWDCANLSLSRPADSIVAFVCCSICSPPSVGKW
jgi:hypothetical protein